MITIEQRGKNLAKIADHGFITPIQSVAYSDPLLLTMWAGGSSWKHLPNNSLFISKAIAIRIPLIFFKNANYTCSYQGDEIPLRLCSLNSDGSYRSTLIESFTSYSMIFNPYNYGLSNINYIAIVFNIPVDTTATITNLQLEEGSVATPYEDPWVNMLNFDDNLHTGEFLQKSSGNIFYIHKNWYRDDNNNTYELLTFNNGIVTPT